jgi:hypothetical protein
VLRQLQGPWIGQERQPFVVSIGAVVSERMGYFLANLDQTLKMGIRLGENAFLTHDYTLKDLIMFLTRPPSS